MAPSSDEKISVDHQDLPAERGLTLNDAERQRKEKALVRKLDCFIAPVMMLLMLISYLDRGNIGFAATQGMTDDLGLKGSDLNAAVSVFYVFYILAEFPTSIFVKRLQFNRVIPLITFCWGVVCLCTGFVQSFGPLIVTRILLGFFEGCQFPAMTLLLCNWYKREELAVRVAYLFIASALSGAFGGLLAWAMLSMNGVQGLAGWRWHHYGRMGLFMRLLSSKGLRDSLFPARGREGTHETTRRGNKCLQRGSGHYDRNDIKEAAKDIKSWLHGFTQIAVVTILYGKFLNRIRRSNDLVTYLLGAGFGTFLPIIIKDGFHYSTVQAQYLVIPVNLWGPSCILLTLTNIGGVVSGQIYYSNAAPAYTLGHAWSLGCLGFAWCMWWIIRFIYIRRQDRKQQLLEDGYRSQSDAYYTDREPDFKYQI
ncbi:hypothetical protein PG997_012513 [Apiospora hydei]|uniref:Major facilitator superfamily (MFS) profile domain-containing protein n=1 Tax=Apiospora hydei TaxID=1337664 RepID=A0ABR1V643_9PEZI